jgi:hypothetical protein
LTAISDIVLPRPDAPNGEIRVAQISGEIRLAAISQNFFVFRRTTTTFSDNAGGENERTLRPKIERPPG